jgi:AcrR family transcriptional regulator
MTSTPENPRTRADARRNRVLLVEAATRAFASGERVSLEAIAKEAGLGIGTLYRNFPTRESLVEAVYHDQVERLRSGARDLLAEHPPAQALRLWADLFAEWAMTKHGMIETFLAMIASGAIELAHTREELVTVLRGFLDAGATAGDIRDDVDVEDVAASLAGILTVAGSPQQRDQAGRLLDLLMDGLRPVPTESD